MRTRIILAVLLVCACGGTPGPAKAPDTMKPGARVTTGLGLQVDGSIALEKERR